MVKTALLFIILFASIGIGISISLYYRKRNIFYKNLIQFCEELLNEINFMHTGLKEMVNRSLNKYGNSFNLILIEYRKYLLHEEVFDVFKKQINKTVEFLKEEERSQLYDFFKKVGGLDVENEAVNIKNYIIAFKQRQEGADKEQNKFSSLYIKMGVIAGLILIIILI